MAKVFLGLGSNVGDRLQHLQSATDQLVKLRHTTIQNISSVYETEPVGKKDQSEFFNAAAELETTLPVHELLAELKGIEGKVGRKDSIRWGPREIDIDILYYDDLILNDDSVHVPHAEISNRRFVLIPLMQIAEGFVDPVRKLDIASLLKFCSDTSTVRKTKFALSVVGKGPRSS